MQVFPAIIKALSINHWQPQLRYFLIQENAYKNQKLNTLSGYLFQLENCQDIYQLNNIVGEMVEFLQNPDQRGIKRAFTRWIKNVLAPSKGIPTDKLQTEQLEEVRDMLAENMRQWEAGVADKAMRQGRMEGEKRGEKKGEKNASVRIAAALLEIIEDDAIIAEKTGLTVAEVKQLRE